MTEVDVMKKEVLLVTRKACPVCMLVKAELEKHQDSIMVRCMDCGCDEGRSLVESSGLRSAPVLSCDGRFYGGKDALAFAVGLKEGI